MTCLGPCCVQTNLVTLRRRTPEERAEYLSGKLLEALVREHHLKQLVHRMRRHIEHGYPSEVERVLYADLCAADPEPVPEAVGN